MAQLRTIAGITRRPGLAPQLRRRLPLGVAIVISLVIPACASRGGGGATMSDAECLSRVGELRAQAEEAWRATEPARDAYRNNPGSFEAKAAVELALQQSARIAADNAQAVADLASGPCRGKRQGPP